MTIYLEHFLAGLVFALTGWGARKACQHKGWEGIIHKLGLTVLLVALETFIVVSTVG